MREYLKSIVVSVFLMAFFTQSSALLNYDDSYKFKFQYELEETEDILKEKEESERYRDKFSHFLEAFDFYPSSVFDYTYCISFFNELHQKIAPKRLYQRIDLSLIHHNLKVHCRS